MAFPLKIDFQNMDPSEYVAARIRNRAEKLSRVCDRVIGCHVTVQAPHRRHRKGNAYRVRIVTNLPGGSVVVGRDPGNQDARADIYVAIRDAFDALERQLASRARRRRGEVKAHSGSETGRVSRLFAAKGYGFIELADGEEIYFHCNAVEGGRFPTLAEGQGVRIVIAETESEFGPQATYVAPVAPMRVVRPLRAG